MRWSCFERVLAVSPGIEELHSRENASVDRDCECGSGLHSANALRQVKKDPFHDSQGSTRT